MKSLELTASGIVRALSTVDDAVRGKAEALATRLSREGIETRAERKGDGSYTVIATGDDLFAREFGSVSVQPDRPIQETIHDLKTSGFPE